MNPDQHRQIFRIIRCVDIEKQAVFTASSFSTVRETGKIRGIQILWTLSAWYRGIDS